MKQTTIRRTVTFSVLAVLLASFLLMPLPTPTAADEVSPGYRGKIVIDWSHGQYKAAAEYLDQFLAANLTEAGFEVVFATGGINSTILSDAAGLVVSTIYGAANIILSSEVEAIGDWFNAGHKFLWVGYDSDFAGQWYIQNMTVILEAVGSHVYGEPTAVQDPVLNAGAQAYRPIANITTTNPNLAAIVEGVTDVVVHSPTLLYGSNSDTPGDNVSAVALEDVTIENVYPILYHSPNGTIVDSDVIYPYAHEDGQVGAFVSVTLELKAGTDGTGVIVVSGGSPIGYYWPMTAWEYSGAVGLNGYNLVENLIFYGVLSASVTPREGKILIDWSHGQYKAAAAYLDKRLSTGLFVMGYDITFLLGGINSTVLADADGLVVSTLYQVANVFLEAEYEAIGDWFNAGHKFLWVGYDSDFAGQWYIDNMTAILEAVGSHVYGEPTAVQDPVLNAGAQAYRPIANGTSDDPFVADCVANVGRVLVHSPTLLYGSDSDTPGDNVSAVALEDVTIENVYPLLYHSPNGTIVDSDTIYPYAHEDGQVGAFVSMTLEVEAGADDTVTIVVSGGSPIGYYWPMTDVAYSGATGLTGYNLVIQTIDFAMQVALTPEPVTTTTTTTTTVATTTTTTTTVVPPPDMTLIIAGIGVAVVVVIILVVLLKKK